MSVTPSPADEEGFTLPELLVVVLITGIVLISLFSSLDNFTKATTSIGNKSITLADVRTATETITRDLRAANPISVQSPVSDYSTKVSFTVYCVNAGVGNCGVDNQRPVTYQVANSMLTQTVGTTSRALLTSRGAPTLAVSLRPGSVVNAAASPVFRYFKRDGTELQTTGAAANPATDFRDCVKTLEIHLIVLPEARSNKPIDVTTRVALRNYNEVSAC